MPRVLASVFLAAALVAALLVAPAAQGASPDVVISQVYGGGGNSGASFSHDFVELFNRGSTAVDVTGWTVQYATAAGTTWQATSLSGSIPPGGYFLVQLFSGGTAGSALPTPDAVGTTNLATSGGKLALVRDGGLLACGATPGSCSASPQVADLLGYGSAASDYEGSGPAPALTNTNAAFRADGGCTDTDQTSADFSTAPAAPRNSSSPLAPCGGSEPPPDDGVSESASVDIDIDAALSIALERPSISFGRAAAGETPASVSERVTVLSTNTAGYALTVHRTAFTPADLPLGVSGSAPAGGQIGAGLADGATAPIPIRPAADLLVGTTGAPSAPAGDVWPLRIGFVSPLPAVPAGRYTAVVTFTVIGR